MTAEKLSEKWRIEGELNKVPIPNYDSNQEKYGRYIIYNLCAKEVEALEKEYDKLKSELETRVTCVENWQSLYNEAKQELERLREEVAIDRRQGEP